MLSSHGASTSKRKDTDSHKSMYTSYLGSDSEQNKGSSSSGDESDSQEFFANLDVLGDVSDQIKNLDDEEAELIRQFQSVNELE